MERAQIEPFKSFWKPSGASRACSEDPPPTLLVEELGDSALTLAARFWVNQETHSLFDVHSAVVQRIKEAAEREKIDVPYPIQTLRLEGRGILSSSPARLDQVLCATTQSVACKPPVSIIQTACRFDGL
jgi:small-conductance mechanosensitive channel